MIKKNFRVCVMLIALCLLCHVTAEAASVSIAGLEYTLDASAMTASVKAKDLTITSADIPARITADGKEYIVTSIADMAFYRCDRMETVTLPETVANVGMFAFMNCTALKEVHIPSLEVWLNISFSNGYGNPLLYGHDLYVGGEKVVELIIPDGTERLNSMTFAGMSMESVSIPASLKNIGESAFYECASLKSVEIPGTVESIGSSAFIRCTALNDVVLGNGLTMAARYMFNECSALKTVHIPASVKEIGLDCFRDCNALEGVYIDDLDAWFRIAFGNPDANPVNYSHTLYINGQSLETLSIGGDMTAVPDNLFPGLRTLRDLILGDKVVSVGEHAFEGCGSLEKVTFGAGLQTIGASAFAKCENLTDVTFGDGLRAIGANAFAGDGNIVKLALNDGLETIGEGAFTDCIRLEEVSFGRSMSKIGKSAFEGCVALNDLRLGQTALRSLGEYCFYGCEALGAIELPASVTEIPSGAFGECKSLVTLPDMSVSSIGFGAFFYCSGLKSTGRIKVGTIGKSAFMDCKNLTDVRLESLEKLSSYTFSGCDNLTNLNVDAVEPPSVESNTFTSYNASLFVPESAVDLYRAHAVWSKFGKIGALGAVADITVEAVTIRVQGDAIVFDGASDGVFIEVYDMSGRRIYRGEARTLTPGRGIFIVRHAGRSTKVTI